jgi:hypothetical protein
MASKPAAHGKRRRTTMVPVTTMEEVPLLSTAELTQLKSELKQAEARIKAGKGIDYEYRSFKERLVSIYRSHPR